MNFVRCSLGTFALYFVNIQDKIDQIPKSQLKKEVGLLDSEYQKEVIAKKIRSLLREHPVHVHYRVIRLITHQLTSKT